MCGLSLYTNFTVGWIAPLPGVLQCSRFMATNIRQVFVFIEVFLKRLCANKSESGLDLNLTFLGLRRWRMQRTIILLFSKIFHYLQRGAFKFLKLWG